MKNMDYWSTDLKCKSNEFCWPYNIWICMSVMIRICWQIKMWLNFGIMMNIPRCYIN